MPTLPLDYQLPARRRRWRMWLLTAVAVGTVAAVAGWDRFRPTLITCRDTGTAARCASNEHQIGLAILLWQQDHGGHYPPALADLLADEPINPGVLVCPGSADVPAAAAGPTTREWAAALAAPGRCSYVYCGHADWTDQAVPNDAVVVYEPMADHGNGAIILFGDGHADFTYGPRAARLIAAAAATTRPVSAATVP